MPVDSSVRRPIYRLFYVDILIVQMGYFLLGMDREKIKMVHGTLKYCPMNHCAEYLGLFYFLRFNTIAVRAGIYSFIQPFLSFL